mgnify:CR=1 FL=1
MKIPERYNTENSTSFNSYWKKSKFNLLPKLLPDVSLEESKQLIPLYFKVDELGDTVATKITILVKPLENFIAIFPYSLPIKKIYL